MGAVECLEALRLSGTHLSSTQGVPSLSANMLKFALAEYGVEAMATEVVSIIE